MTALYCSRCRRFHDSSESCEERSRGGRSGPTTLPGAIFQGLFLGIMFGFPFGQLTNSPEPFLAVALPIWFLRVGYHVVKHRKPRERPAVVAEPPKPEVVAQLARQRRLRLRWVARVLGAVAGLGALVGVGVWWSQRPTQEELLYRASSRGEVETVRRLLDEGAAARGPAGDPFPPVCAAARSPNAATVRLLLDRGADANQRVGELSALHIAVEYRRIETVRLLIERGADPSVRDGQLRTPLAIAVQPAADLAIVRELLQAGASPNDWLALYTAPPEALAVLLAASKDPGLVSEDRRTNLLGLAASRGCLEGARALLAKGALVDEAPPAGRRPLIEALTNRRPKLVALLLEHGASPDPLSDGEPPPLELAVEQGLPEAAQALLGKGAQVRLCPKLMGEKPEGVLEYARQAEGKRR